MKQNWNDLEKGFYYHYKHDPDRGVNDYAYEVLNIAYHTEIEWEIGAFVIYRSLYDSSNSFIENKHWNARPFEMFMEDVTKEGKTFKRFSKIEDPDIITELEKIRDNMYK